VGEVSPQNEHASGEFMTHASIVAHAPALQYSA
jgi:hypothetical protein